MNPVNWIKRLFCTHTYEWDRNIHGDEIIACGWMRSVWRCAKCGHRQYRQDLHK